MPPSQQGNGHVARRAAETTHAASDANTTHAPISMNDPADSDAVGAKVTDKPLLVDRAW